MGAETSCSISVKEQRRTAVVSRNPVCHPLRIWIDSFQYGFSLIETDFPVLEISSRICLLFLFFEGF